jgi:thiamine-phosphate pyrophosphorylase
MHKRILRAIDANFNRVGEGLRVLEDVARFVIEDEATSRQLKSIRHQLARCAANLGPVLWRNRDVNHDVGAKFDLTREHEDLASIVRANSKRTQEGLRVLEELAKLPALKSLLSMEELKEARYQVYVIEKTLLMQLAHSLETDEETGGNN